MDSLELNIVSACASGDYKTFKELVGKTIDERTHDLCIQAMVVPSVFCKFIKFLYRHSDCFRQKTRLAILAKMRILKLTDADVTQILHFLTNGKHGNDIEAEYDVFDNPTLQIARCAISLAFKPTQEQIALSIVQNDKVAKLYYEYDLMEDNTECMVIACKLGKLDWIARLMKIDLIITANALDTSEKIRRKILLRFGKQIQTDALACFPEDPLAMSIVKQNSSVIVLDENRYDFNDRLCEVPLFYNEPKRRKIEEDDED